MAEQPDPDGRPGGTVPAPSGARPPVGAPTGARRGRPLAADRTDAILEATNELFDEVGYDQLTVQDIAARAGVGLATLYRRWPSKNALVVDALRRRQARDTVMLEGTPQEQLRTLFHAIAKSTVGDRSEFLPGLLSAIRSEDALADDVRTGILDPLAAVIRSLLGEILGPDHPQIDLLVDVMPSVCVWKALAPTDAADVDVDRMAASYLDLVEQLAADAGR